jgi:phosphoserine phosphatase RsbU/P
LQHERGPDRRRGGLSNAYPADGSDRRSAAERRHNGFILGNRLFNGIPWHRVEAIMARCDSRDLAPGDILLEPGKPNDSIFLLASGQLGIHLEARDSREFIPIEPGGCIGELSIIDGRPVSAWVTAEAPSRVVLLPEHRFWDELIPVAGVARNLMRMLAARMRQSNETIVERLRERLAFEHLQSELKIAGGIQSSMLPKRFPLFPDLIEVDLHASMDPAKEIGGDFYDAFFVGDDRLFVAVGDVSGKGVPAALFMARAMTLLRMEALRGAPPAEILSRVNEQLCENNDAGMFVTLFCGVLDVKSGAFDYSNAGHNPPLTGAANRDFARLAVPRGLVAGMIEGAVFKDAHSALAPGDVLLLYTDGVTEAMNPENELYGEERLLSLLDAARFRSAQSLVNAVRKDVVAFATGAAQSDDITLLAIRYLAPEEREGREDENGS